MPWPCVNAGGSESLIRLDSIPVLETEVALPEDSVRALAFWKVRPGQILTLILSEHRYFRARLTQLSDHEARVVPFFEFVRPVESSLRLTVFQALPEKERFELILQKLTEIGVQRIVPFRSGRSTTLARRDALQQKSHRWPEVVLRAARQCRRAMIPELSPVTEWPAVLEEMADAQRTLLFFEGPGEALGSLPQRSPLHRLALIVGPEGGFDPAEVCMAAARGAEVVSLGPRLLRTETAAIAAATACQVIWGDFALYGA